MNNQELVAKIDEVVEALQAIERHLGEIVIREREREALQAAFQEAQRQQALQAAQTAAVQPREAGWPWTPDTLTQGFLAARWLRRDGNGPYPPAVPGTRSVNSPIRGGDDADAKVDVPSGAPRVAPFGQT